MLSSYFYTIIALRFGIKYAQMPGICGEVCFAHSDHVDMIRKFVFDTERSVFKVVACNVF